MTKDIQPSIPKCLNTKILYYLIFETKIFETKMLIQLNNIVHLLKCLNHKSEFTTFISNFQHWNSWTKRHDQERRLKQSS